MTGPHMPADNIPAFDATLPGYDLEALMARTASERGWLIAYGHDVMDGPTPYGCTPDDLDRVIRLAKAADLDILPVAAAWERVAG